MHPEKASTEVAPDLLEVRAFLDEFCREHVPQADLNIERRSEPRFSVVVPAVIRPVDEDLRPLGEAVCGVTHDISATGVGLILSQRIESQFVHLTLRALSGKTCQLVVEVRHQESQGIYYRLGGKIITGAQK